MAKILIVDDEQGMRDVVAKLLVPRGYEVIPAEDGAQAIECYRRDAPDAVILDIRLPDMDGLEILDQLKKINPGVPVIILSGFYDGETVGEFVKQGAFQFLSKPFKVDDLLQAITRALGGKAGSPGVSSGGARRRPARARVLSKRTVAAATAAVLAVLAAGILIRTCGRPRQASFSLPYANPSGICSDGKTLWVSDWVSGTLFRHQPDGAFSLISSCTVAGVEPTGIAFDGKYLWISYSFGQKIFRRLPDAALTAAGEFASPGPSPCGLYFDGTWLWSLDFQQSRVYRHSLDKDLTVTASFDSPATNPCGIFRAGKNIYIADTATNRIFMVDPVSFIIRGVYVLPGYEDAARARMSAVSGDGGRVWACFDGTPTIVRTPLGGLKKVKF